MTTMTPVTLLVGFCVAMSAIAVGRLALDEDRDRVDLGSAITVVGITVLSAAWAAVEESALSADGRVALAVVGLAVTGTGVATMARYWTESPEPRAVCD